MTWNTARHGLVLTAAVLVFTGCAPSMQIQQQELRDPAPDEGTVIGSVSIRGGKDILGRTKWEVGISNTGKGTRAASEYSIQAHREGKEEVFVAAMPAGEYRIYELRQPGFSSFKTSTDIRFQVHPGRILYIGRLLIEFPQETISIFTPIRMTIENAGDATIGAAKEKYHRQFSDVSTALMAVNAGLGTSLPGKTSADPGLEKDTLALIMGMDRVEDKSCNQRKVADREVISADSKGAQEYWTLDRCGTLVRYRITYSPGQQGGTMIGVVPGEVVGKQ